jgi:prefoldin subunit 5
MDDLIYDYDPNYLLQQINELQKRIQDFREENAALRMFISELEEEAKITPHPSALKLLEKRVEELSNAMRVALSMIPETRSNMGRVARLWKISKGSPA